MNAALSQDARDCFPARIENPEAAPGLIVVCEHASNSIPARWGDLGLSSAERVAHIAWDPGALGLARGLAGRLGAVLVHAPVSRLVYDCNRAPHQTGAMPVRSEVHQIPGNLDLSADERLARTRAVYLPFHADLRGVIAAQLAAGIAPVVVTIHSFTPVYFGAPRAVQFGVIHDADDRLARLIVAEATRQTQLRTALNEPYSAVDDVTHTLRLQATPYGLANAMLEIRNDLIATPEAEAAMAETLAPVLGAALAQLRNGK